MTDKEKTALQNEIINKLPLRPHGRLLLAPRVGKTRIAIEVIKKNKPQSILWVTPSASLAQKAIPEEFIKWGAKEYLPKLTTSTWKSLPKIKGRYSIIILDEEHYITQNNAVNLLNGTLSGHILSMTGTPTKHIIKQVLYTELGLKVLHRISVNKAVDIGILSNYEINVLKIALNSKDRNVQAGRKPNYFYSTEKDNYEYLDKVAKDAIRCRREDVKFRIIARSNAIKNSPSKAVITKHLWKTLKGRKLFFCSSIKQANSITPKVYHSKSDKTYLEQFINGEIDEICMVNSGGTGFTYKELDHLVLVQADSDKNGQTLQKICRPLLSQKDFKAKIWILCLQNTQDEVWVNSVLEKLDKTKINYKIMTTE